MSGIALTWYNTSLDEGITQDCPPIRSAKDLSHLVDLANMFTTTRMAVVGRPKVSNPPSSHPSPTARMAVGGRPKVSIPPSSKGLCKVKQILQKSKKIG